MTSHMRQIFKLEFPLYYVREATVTPAPEERGDFKYEQHKNRLRAS